MERRNTSNDQTASGQPHAVVHTLRTPGLLVCVICNSCQCDVAAEACLRCSNSVPAPWPVAQSRGFWSPQLHGRCSMAALSPVPPDGGTVKA